MSQTVDNIRLTQEEQRRIDDFCASFVDASGPLMALSSAVTMAVKRHVALHIEQKMKAYLQAQP